MLGLSNRIPCQGAGHYVLYFVVIFLCVGLTLQQDETCVDAGDYCRLLRPDECYHNDEFCCKSCKKLETVEEIACKYGDKATVCTSEYCLYSWNLELCCHTCRNNLTTTTVIPSTTTRSVTITVPLVENNETTTSTVSTSPTEKPCLDGVINQIPCRKYIQSNGKHLCYRYEELCCVTCGKMRQKRANCPFGDRHEWCDGLSRDQCYANNATCCETCKTMRTNISECPFGDSMPSYCSTLFPEDCYEENKFCCATCNQFILPGANPECKYGDRIETKKCFRHRRNGRCDEKEIRGKCCKTCVN